MKGIVRSLMAVAVCCALAFTTACGDGGGDAQANRAMGRYVESEVSVPEGILLSLHHMEDGSVNLLLYDEAVWSRKVYNTRDFETWQQVELSWYDKLPEAEAPEHLAYGKDGQIFVHANDYEGDWALNTFRVIPKLYRVTEEGTDLEQIPVDWYQSPDNGFYVNPNEIAVLENGDIIALQNFDRSIVQYGRDGSFKGLYDADYDTDFSVTGNTITILDGRAGAVRSYDGASREMIDQVNFENYTEGSRIFYGQGDVICIQNDQGLYRLAEGGSLWEKIIDGDMTSMALPTRTFSDHVGMENGDFYMIRTDSNIGITSSVLMRYRFDPNVSSLPDKELVIYALRENTTLRLAATEFQKLHPDTKVSIEIAGGAEGVTQSDLLRVLNTELLNGKGPDMLILDGMNVDDYIDKGILEDVTDVITELSSDGSFVDAVLNAYERDGRIHAVPVKFFLPVMIIGEAEAGSVSTLSDLARYAQEHPEKGITGDQRARTLFDTLMPASSASWIDGSSIDRDNLREFLECLKAIMDTEAPSYILVEEDYTESDARSFLDWYHFAYGRTNTYMDMLRGLYVTNMYSNAIAQRGDGVVTYMPGQQEKTFVPFTTVGINVGSSEKESAKEFLKVMMSDGVQYDNGLMTGLSVSIRVMEEEASEYQEDSLTGWAGRSFYEGEDLNGPWAPVPFRQEVVGLAQGVLNPALSDETLENMIVDSVMGYLTGEKSLEQALNDADEATRLYLAE